MSAQRLRVASYNIRKAIGLDRRRDPDRIMAVLLEIGADIIALQEADRRFGRRLSALPLALIDESPWRAVALDTRPDSIGWHGNALLVRKDIAVGNAAAVPLPTLEPRGAISADIAVAPRRIRVIGMHLDLSGLRRRQQARAIMAFDRAAARVDASVLMGDLNDWSLHGGAIGEFARSHHVLNCGRSFHSRRPMAALDRIILSPGVEAENAHVHHSALAARASDHLPIVADLTL